MSLTARFSVHLRRSRTPTTLVLYDKNVTANDVPSQARSSHASARELKSFEKIPGPKSQAWWQVIFFKPHSPHSRKRPDLMFRDLHRKYGDIVRMRLPPGPTVLLKDPQDMLTVVHSEGKYPTRSGVDVMRNYVNSKHLKSLAHTDGESWYCLRRETQPKFLRQSAIYPYVPNFERIADDLVKCVRSNREAEEDLRNFLAMYSLECVGEYCFDSRLGVLTSKGINQNNEIAKTATEFSSGLNAIPLFPVYKLWKTKNYRKVENSLDHLIAYCRQEAERRKERGERESRSHLIRSLESDLNLSPDEIGLLMSEFIAAGTIKAARILGILLMHITQYPEQQKKLYEEIRNIVGKGEVTAEHLKQMEFTKACVKESMRLVFPLAIGPARFLPHDVPLAGYNVPKGTLAILSNNAYIHDPDFVRDPDIFKPKRWLHHHDTLREEGFYNVACMPFGFGSRSCLGRRLAEKMMAMALIKLVQNYELHFKPNANNVSILYESFPTTDRPLQIEFKPRPGQRR